MTEISFKGKEFVYNHHLSVPFRPLEMHADKGIGDPRLDGNLIIQGDNLHALKALLPLYAGKVDCIFIDPPYNTGNEGWAYNDNVNAPMIKAWMADNPIGIEDGLRHDKWCAMMWPRLRLLWELLADDGALFVSIDDHEQHTLRSICSEIFGEENFVNNVIWQKKYAPANDAKWLSDDHDFILVFAKNKELWRPEKLAREEKQNKFYKNPDNDKRGRWRPDNYLQTKTKEERPNSWYAIIHPDTGDEVWPNSGSVWRYSKEEHFRHVRENRIWWGIENKNPKPAFKRFLVDVGGIVPTTIWTYDQVGHNQEAKREVMEIFDSKDVFATPKPKRLIERIINIGLKEGGLILDSFAGSGTTAHAVLEANKKDGSNRRFILCEMEVYADELTAERVRRVINGYEFTGTQKTELMREKISWTKLKKAGIMLKEVQAIENLHGQEYDAIKPTVKDGELIVTGETKVKTHAKGLGGEFTYCTLGKTIALDDILTGEALPDYTALGSVLFHMATNRPLEGDAVDEVKHYLGETVGQKVWLIYRPDLDWLQSPDAALTLSFARKLAREHPDTKHLVFAPARYVSQKMLKSENLDVDFAPLPYALYRVERE